MNKKVIFCLLVSIIMIFTCIFILSIVEFSQVWYQDFHATQSWDVQDEFKEFAVKWFSINIIVMIFELFIICGLIVLCWYVFKSELKDKDKRLAESKARKEKSKQEKREKLLKQLEELDETSEQKN